MAAKEGCGGAEPGCSARRTPSGCTAELSRLGEPRFTAHRASPITAASVEEEAMEPLSMSSNSPASGAAERRGPGATPTERCSRRHVHPTGELTPPDLTGQVAGRVRGALQRVPAPSQPGAAAAAGTHRGPRGCQRSSDPSHPGERADQRVLAAGRLTERHGWRPGAMRANLPTRPHGCRAAETGWTPAALDQVASRQRWKSRTA